MPPSRPHVCVVSILHVRCLFHIEFMLFRPVLISAARYALHSPMHALVQSLDLVEFEALRCLVW